MDQRRSVMCGVKGCRCQLVLQEVVASGVAHDQIETGIRLAVGVLAVVVRVPLPVTLQESACRGQGKVRLDRA